MKKEQFDLLLYSAAFGFLYHKMRFPFDVCKEIAEKVVYEKK